MATVKADLTSGKSSRAASSMDDHSVTEETPLLTGERRASVASLRTRNRSITLRVLLTGFLVSLSFGVTQVPLIYVFGVMTCDEYYKTHPYPPPEYGNRCRVHEIESSTAESVAILGASTTLFGVINLFFTSWTIKAFGLKRALMVTVGLPAVRLAVQNVGVEIGAGLGIVIVQASQIITVIGGPVGYLLALNSFATEVVEPAERTATLGRLSGCAMFGTAFGYLAGGYLGDVFTIIMPFRVTLALFTLSFIYVSIALPNISSTGAEQKAAKTLSGFFDPLKMFAPTKWVLQGGRVKTEYGVLLLGIGVFLGVLATSYIPVLLQMYSTDIFDFATKENGWLISVNSLIRGIFLTFAFPVIIAKGRKWLDGQDQKKPAARLKNQDGAIPDLPTDPREIAAAPEVIEQVQEPVEPPKPVDEDVTFTFDLWFTKYSLIADGLLTGLATFTTEGWQMYLIAVILPLASGTGPAAKGTILQMCSTAQRADALSAISLVELVARLSSTAVFGLLFAAFTEKGQPNLIFTCNAAIATVGFVVLMFCRFPPFGSTRYVESDDNVEPSIIDREGTE